MAYAYCYRSGEIEIATRRSNVPEGAIVFASGARKSLAETLAARSRYAYGDDVLLVPGVPEAETDAKALDALDAWTAWAFPENGGDA